jgi:cysteine desulfurase
VPLPLIYLDHHATTPVDPGVLEAMLPYFGERFGNPSSRQHAAGQEAHAAVEAARASLAAAIGARPEDIIWTSGATEANNLALRGLAGSGTGRHLVATAIEHSAVLEPLRRLGKEGFEVTLVAPAGDGVVDPQAIVAALRDDTALVSVMAANNEIGTLQPIAEIGRACAERGIPLHCDAAQALGRVSVDVEDWHVDLMSLSAHKAYGPKGVGALYVRKARKPRLRLRPILDGGGQEKGLRPGTLNVPAIVGFGAAARIAAESLRAGEPRRLLELRGLLLEALEREIGGVQVNGCLDRRLPGNLHVSFEGAEAETVILAAGAQVAVSSGAACAEGDGKGSHVLRAIGLSDERVYTSVRFGLGRHNTRADVEGAVSILRQSVAAARARVAPTRPR